MYISYITTQIYSDFRYYNKFEYRYSIRINNELLTCLSGIGVERHLSMKSSVNAMSTSHSQTTTSGAVKLDLCSAFCSPSPRENDTFSIINSVFNPGVEN